MLMLFGGNLTSAQTGGEFTLTWWTVDGGGSGGGIDTTKRVTGGSYELLSTAGQPDAHDAVRGGGYVLLSGFWPSGIPRTDLYLPIVLKGAGPDLVGTFTLTPNKISYSAGEPVLITAVITNVGSPAASAFWVDFYINPSTTPKVNLRWNDTCSLNPCYGLTWLVSGLDSGQSISLTSAPGGFDGSRSSWPGSFAGGTNNLYLYVDTWNPGVPTGGVAESNESNNIYQRDGITVAGLGTTTTLNSLSNLLPRPAP